MEQATKVSERIADSLIRQAGERGGLVINASDTGSKGRGFEPHSGQTVLCPLAGHIYSPKSIKFSSMLTENYLWFRFYQFV